MATEYGFCPFYACRDCPANRHARVSRSRVSQDIGDCTDQAAAKEKLADSLLKLNEVDEAAKLLKEVCSISDDQPQPQIILAEAERRLGNMDAARAAIERAMELGVDPQQRAQCNTILGQLSLANQQPSAAVEYLMTAVELTPQDAVAQLALGRALTLAGNQELGQVHIERAQQIRDSYEQIQTWTRAVIENPQDPDLRTKIGQAMIDQGMRSEGVRWVQTALECDSGFAPAKEILDRMATFNGPTP